ELDRRIVLDPVGDLARIPFVLLRLPDGSFFMERFKVSTGVYADSDAEPRKVPMRYALVVGSGAVPDAVNVEPLAEVELEARDVSSRFRRASLFLGSEATLENARREVFGADVFHFVGHAVETADGGALAFASNGNA